MSLSIIFQNPCCCSSISSACFVRHVSCVMSRVSCLLCHVLCVMSLVSCLSCCSSISSAEIGDERGWDAGVRACSLYTAGGGHGILLYDYSMRAEYCGVACIVKHNFLVTLIRTCVICIMLVTLHNVGHFNTLHFHHFHWNDSKIHSFRTNEFLSSRKKKGENAWFVQIPV
jgi:hypothetical protein